MPAIEAEIVSRPAVYQDYSIDRKAEVLALVKSNTGNIAQTARETGIPYQTIQTWLINSDRFAEIQCQKQTDLASRFEGAANDWLTIAEGKAKDAPFNQLMTGVGIAVDKMQLLRGAPTSINLNLDLNGNDLAGILSGALADVVDTDGPDGP